MEESFKKAIDFILRWEGYKSDDPKDKGGRTVFGISERVYPEDVGKMWDMPKEDARAIAVKIYLRDYWIPLACDTIQYPMDVIAMDCAVNQGISVARRFIKEARDPCDYLMKRIERYCAGDPKYLRGWINRIIALHKMVNDEPF